MIQVKCDNTRCRFSVEGICQKVFLELQHDITCLYGFILKMESKVT